jgi:hypothetical protein
VWDLRLRSFAHKVRSYDAVMDTNEIRRRLIWHQNRINSLATLLPAEAQLDFWTVDCTEVTDVAERKRLVLTITEIRPEISHELLDRVKSRR